jgi:L,D-peptidoglycan transpeptidase YkuD (ErfK/YbiS/YcfS/YnhG family)
MGFSGTLTVTARRAPGDGRKALVVLAQRSMRAALGRAGIMTLKCEGDGGTPLGRLPFREVFYRADRSARPCTRLPCRAIRAMDAWCDDPKHPSYNRLTRRSNAHGSEGLKRADHIYDIVVVLGYNDRPRVKGKGSAIFMHLARPGYTPTDGCIALSRRDLLALLRQVGRGSTLVVSR